MSVYENTLLITLLFIGVLSILSSYLMLWKLPLIKKVDVKNIPYVQPMISIIIPARNEERTIENLLSSLEDQQYPHYEVIVVDDESIDKTAEVAKRYGAKVIHQGKKKWKGKSAACWNGAKVARGDLFLFLDADTRLDHSKALASMVDIYQKKGRTGLLSIQPYHVVQSIYENFSVLFNIMVITGMNVFTIWKERFQSGGSFGPCILTSREDYFFSGGHKQVADAVMDGIELGKGYRRKGLPVSCLGGKGTINFRMYPNGGKELVNGWTKSFASGASFTHPIIMVLIYLWIGGGLLSIGCWFLPFITNYSYIFLLFYGVFCWRFYLLARKVGSFSLVGCFFYPIYFFFFVILFARSFYFTRIKGEVVWKERNIKI